MRLAIVARVGDSIEEGDRWTIKLGRRPEDAHPSGMLLRFRGWPFMLSWDAPFTDWRGMVFDGAVYSAADLLVRPNRFKMNTPGTLALRFSWAPTFAASRELVALRGRYPAPGR